VVSVPTGASIDADGGGVIDSSLKKQLPWLMKFKTVVLCLDQDSPGQALAVKLAEELAGECQVKFMTFQAKDAKDMADKGLAYEFMQALNSAKTYVPDNILRGCDVDIDWLMEPSSDGVSLPFPQLNKKLHGLRNGVGGGELTLICSGTGMGKSTLCREIGYWLRKQHGKRVGNIYLEEQAKKTMQAYIALDNNIPLPELRLNPTMLSREKWEKSKKELVDESVFYNHFGSLASTRLINEMRYMHTREGCDFIILDHISLVVSGMDEGKGGERKDIDKLMTQLAAFVTVTGCHIIAVVHLKRRNGFVKKDRDGQIDRENAPYNRGGRISLDDLRGSAGLEQMSFNIIAVEGDQDEIEGSPDLRWLRVLKNREWGELGLADSLRYNRTTGRFKVSL
jgi:twinkle protein